MYIYDPRRLILQAGDVERNPGPPLETKEICSECDKTLRKGVTPLTCTSPGCRLKCHINQRCSGISRWTKTKTWRCHAHGGKAKHQKETEPPQPVAQRNVPRKCLECKGTMNVKNSTLICHTCGNPCHKGTKCSGLSRDGVASIQVHNGLWVCKKCDKHEERDYVTTNPRGVEVSERTIGPTKNGLTVLQWNADGLSTKTTELRERLLHEDIDVCVVQESKLKKNLNSPKIYGYNTILRADRKGMMAGGGLIIYAKNSIIFENIQSSTVEGTDSATVKIKMQKNKWISISNVYTPPVNSTSQLVNFNPIKIDTVNCLILGDLNAHSPLWDSHLFDKRGEEIEDWIISNSLVVLNDGSATRINKHTGNGSTPDVSLVSTEWKNKCRWSIGDQIGNSDHLPIKVVIQSVVHHQPLFTQEARWKRNGVNWENFRKEVENRVSGLKLEPNMKRRAHRFDQILKDAAIIHVGKTKPGRKTNTVITPTVNAALKKRNKLRKKVSTHREEWIEACKEARDATNKAKEQSWKDLLDSAISDIDDSRLWKIIKSLEGCPESNSPNEVMIHNGKTITSNERKAEIFAQHYARISKHCFSKKERRTNLEAKKKTRYPSHDSEYCRDFTRDELVKAINNMKRKGAQGPDDIPPSFLKELGPRALDELLSIFNYSWRTSTCPQSWRNATIIPLLKANSPACELASFRPISLTSCVSKTLEKMIAHRLHHLAEKKGWLNFQQAGFRKGRGCDDQIAKIVQAIENGFQSRPMKRSVIALLDFSKAYDTVWRERLLLSMIDQGVPKTFIRWLHAFLQNRQARVRFCGADSKSKKIRQGLPQGSALSPILFLFYINSLAEILPQCNTNSLFADDVSILATANSLEEAETSVQKAVDIVSRWACDRKLQLNVKKSEVSYFSSWTKEANWAPTVTINDEKIKFSATPRLLGVILDRNLNFGPHVDKITDRLTPKFRILGAVANTKWGWRKEHLMKVYKAHVESVVHYAGFAWQPNTPKTCIDRLSRLQNKAIRLVTGQLRSSPKESIRAEAGVPSLETQIKRNAVKAMEKGIRLPADHPRRIAYDSAIPTRNMRGSWRSMADKERALLPDMMRKAKPLLYFNSPPWLSTTNLMVHSELAGIKRSDAEEFKRRTTMERIKLLDAGTIIYTDGSASEGLYNGGSALVVTDGDPEVPTIITKIARKGSPVTCSYEEEMDAVEAATAWVRDNIKDTSTTLICTDSQSLCKAINNLNTETEVIRQNIAKCSGSIIIQWIPGHSSIPGNVLADQEAKKATKTSTQSRAVSFRSACALVKLNYTDSISHERTRKAYEFQSKARERNEINNRRDQVNLAQLRSGHHTAFKAYKNRLDDKVDPMCPLCKEEPHTAEHWWGCTSTLTLRKELFQDEAEMGIALLSRYPSKSIALAKKTLFGVDE